MAAKHRSLARVAGLNVETLSKLEGHNFRTAEDVLTRSSLDLVELLDISLPAAERVVASVARNVCPKPTTARALLASRVAPAGYVYDYTIAVDGQPKRHLKTVFSVVPSGAASMIIAFTAQCRQDDYKTEQAELDRILASYSLGEKKGKK